VIKGGRITSVEAKREKIEPIKGLGINITIDDVKTSGNQITVSYTYTVNYEENVGKLTMKGEILLEEDEEKVKEIEKLWKSDKKKLPDDLAELLLNTINYVCGTNGTLVVKVVNLSPPMVPPRITFAKGGATAKA